MPIQQNPPAKKKSFFRSKGMILIIVIGIIGLWGIISRIEASSDLHKRTEDDAIPVVVVMKAPMGTGEEEIVLPGNVQAWHEAPIFARTNGYLKRWLTDIGAHVNAGDLLAEIDTPEVDAQLHQAEADLGTAVANNNLAQTTAKRWVDLLKTNSVSKQETDEKTGDAAAKAALVASAKANLDRLQQLEGFKRVTAPFAGVVTARNTDNGALINAGSTSGQGQELFHVAEIDKLRAYVQVPQTYTPAITPDLKVTLRFTEYPGRDFPATLLDTAHALDPATRTLLVQFMVDNSKGDVMPGGYAQVHMKLAGSKTTVRLPVNTLIFRADGIQVATIDGDNKAQLKSVIIGRDFGKEVEITSGVAVGEAIIVNPPDSLVSGQKVRIDDPKKDKDGKDKDTGKDAKKS